MATNRDLEIIEQYDAALNKLEQRHIDRVNAALDASARELERDLTRAYNAAKDQKDLLPQQRSLLVMDQIQQYRALLQPEQGTAIRRSLERLLNNAYESGFSMGEDLLRAAGVPNVRAFSSVPLEAVAAQARDGMQRLRRHTQDFASRASAIVEQGLVQGWGSRRVQRLIRDQLGTTKSKAETIARTEVMSAQNTASQQRYKRYGIEYEQVIATPSDRLCGQCAARNMKIYKVGTVSVPSHPRCRCITTPVDPSFPRDMEFEQGYQEQILSDLRDNGIKPDYGPSPFERMAGQTTAPLTAQQQIQQQMDRNQGKLDVLSRNYGTIMTRGIRDRADAMVLGLQPGQRPATPPHKMREQLLAEQGRLQRDIDRLGVGREIFNSGIPLTQKQIERKLTQSELRQLGGLTELPDLRGIPRNSDRYGAVERLHRAYREAQQSAPGLTVAEFKTLRAYTKGSYYRDRDGVTYGYVPTNAAARGLFNDPNSDVARSSVSQARLVHQALGRLPKWQGTVRRDTVLPSNEASFEVGQSVTFHGVTSTTRDLSGSRTSVYGKQESNRAQTGRQAQEQDKASRYDQVAQEIGIATIPDGQKQRVQYEIRVSSGRDISRLSAASAEQEIALRHGWTGTVAGVETLDDGTIKVILEEN